MSQAKYSPADLLAEMRARGYRHASITSGTRVFEFWIDPQEWHYVSQPLFLNVPTRDGVGRFSFNQQPYQYTLIGNTGNGGLDQLELGKKGLSMRTFRPQFGRKDQVVLFTFPAVNLFKRRVYVDKFESYAMASDPFLHSYNIQLSELPPTSTFIALPGPLSGGSYQTTIPRGVR